MSRISSTVLTRSATTEAVVRAVEAASRPGLIPARTTKEMTFDISGCVLLAGTVDKQHLSFVHRPTSLLMVRSALVPDSCCPKNLGTRPSVPMVTLGSSVVRLQGVLQHPADSCCPMLHQFSRLFRRH